MPKTIASMISSVAVVFAVAISLPGFAHAQGVLEACSDDVENYCSAVTLGNGRLFACFYAHEDKLSEACDAAILDVADQLDVFFEGLRNTVQECSGDINKHCQGVEFAGGRIFSCLKDNSSKLSDACTAVIDEIELPAN